MLPLSFFKENPSMFLHLGQDTGLGILFAVAMCAHTVCCSSFPYGLLFLPSLQPLTIQTCVDIEVLCSIMFPDMSRIVTMISTNHTFIIAICMPSINVCSKLFLGVTSPATVASVLWGTLGYMGLSVVKMIFDIHNVDIILGSYWGKRGSLTPLPGWNCLALDVEGKLSTGWDWAWGLSNVASISECCCSD